MNPVHRETAQPARGIAFLASYLPRACGIATFTHDLADAVKRQAGKDQSVIVTAVNDIPEGYAYSNRVKFEIRQDHQIDYARAADFLNFSGIGVLSLQHEYGIFGGTWGSNVLTLLRDLRRPVVATCHTVLHDPEPEQREVFQEIAARVDRVVVMTEKAREFLDSGYKVAKEKIVLIPHGIHDVPFIDPNYYKDKFGVEGRRVILTFGLLSRNKGIEYMIEALPDIVAKHPRTTYLVLGATHPAVVRDEGESYRLELQRRVRELGLEEHVLFHPRFVELEELLEYIGATDIFVSPYLNMDQITSGALSYAMGAGKAVVSTPFWHAEELLADKRGHLVPTKDSQALARAVLSLLDDEVALSAMRKRAYTYCRNMVWSAVARSYLQLFDEVTSHVPKPYAHASAMRRPIAPTNLPTPKISHLVRLSDATGPAHHARHTLPDWSHGYHLADAAGVLVASAKFHDIFNDERAGRLAETCTALLHTLIGDGSNVSRALDYARHPVGAASETDLAMALWSLGYLINNGPASLTEPAIDLFQQLFSRVHPNGPRACGYGILAAANYLWRFPGASDVKRFLTRQTQTLVEFSSTPGWIERWDDADWPMLVQALAVVGRTTDSNEIRSVAKERLNDALEATSRGTVFFRTGPNPDDEELPVTAAVFIEAMGASFRDSHDPDLITAVRAAADWFLGANRLDTPVYNFSTGGCHDALHADGVNQNQGTQATLFCLLAFLTLHRLAAAADADANGNSDSG